MRITTRGRYGVRAMLGLADHYGQGPMLMAKLADDLDVSRKYLHALLTTLRKERLVVSTRGMGGGYSLARPPEDITVADIFLKLEGCDSLVQCLQDSEKCDKCEICIARQLWGGLGKVIEDYLAGFTLADLLRQGRRRRKKT